MPHIRLSGIPTQLTCLGQLKLLLCVPVKCHQVSASLIALPNSAGVGGEELHKERAGVRASTAARQPAHARSLFRPRARRPSQRRADASPVTRPLLPLPRRFHPHWCARLSDEVNWNKGIPSLNILSNSAHDR